VNKRENEGERENTWIKSEKRERSANFQMRKMRERETVLLCLVRVKSVNPGKE